MVNPKSMCFSNVQRRVLIFKAEGKCNTHCSTVQFRSAIPSSPPTYAQHNDVQAFGEHDSKYKPKCINCNSSFRFGCVAIANSIIVCIWSAFELVRQSRSI